jgi:hypothetical protein
MKVSAGSFFGGYSGTEDQNRFENDFIFAHNFLKNFDGQQKSNMNKPQTATTSIAPQTN